MNRIDDTISGIEDIKPAAFLPPDDKCDLCDGIGIVIGERGETRKCECGAFLRNHVSTYGPRANIQARFRNGFDNWRSVTESMDSAHARCLQYACDYKRGDAGMLLSGEPGTGKTRLVCAAGWRILERGYRVLFHNTTGLFADIRAAMDETSESSEADILESCRKVDVLILDDLGAEKPSDYVEQIIYLILNRRIEDQKTVIATSNIAAHIMANRLGSRVVSRIYELAPKGNRLVVSGPDQRKEA